MKDEHEIEALVQAAQTDGRAADDLIMQYMPFIRSETAKFLKRFPEDGHDELSIAMFAFYEAAMAYQHGRGTFLKLAASAIRNRLIDYSRKEQRHKGYISLDAPLGDEDEEAGRSLGDQVMDKTNDYEQFHEQTAAKKEINEFTEQLGQFGLSLSDIADNCPKQERTLAACMAALDYAREHPDLLDQLLHTKKLPIAQLTQGVQVERKTLERHRKYIVAILLAYTNGFEIIRGHLCLIKRKEATRL